MAASDLTLVKPYGDTKGDGAVQLSFTLPVAAGPQAKEAARQLAVKMGLSEIDVAWMEDLGGGFAFFVLYGHLQHTVNYLDIHVAEVPGRVMNMEEINRFIQDKFGRRVTMLGACIESDAHTVGIDAIMSMKGYHGHKGLEAYREIRAVNLGAQVSCEDLLHSALREEADALLISQVVTQKNIHLQNLTKLMDMLEAEGLRQRLIVAIGGPRISQELAQELGFDAGFGPGCHAGNVASFVVQEMERRLTAQTGGGENV